MRRFGAVKVLAAAITIMSMYGPRSLGWTKPAPRAPSLSLLNGLWLNSHPGGMLSTEDGQPIPLRPGISLLDPEPSAQAPPSAMDIDSRCSPLGAPRVWLGPLPFQITALGRLVAIVYESRHSYRLIYLDAPTPDPNTSDPWYFGHSVGKWDGKSLTVKSTVFNTATRLDSVLPHSDALAVTEQFRLVDGGRTLSMQATIEDPKIFTRPWTAKFTFKRAGSDKLEEYVCGIGVLSTRDSRP